MYWLPLDKDYYCSEYSFRQCFVLYRLQDWSTAGAGQRHSNRRELVSLIASGAQSQAGPLAWILMLIANEYFATTECAGHFPHIIMSRWSDREGPSLPPPF